METHLNQLTFSQQQASQRLTHIYQTIYPNNVVSLLLPQEQKIFNQWQHYPSGDVKDLKHHTQYYYHSHPSHDVSRLPEHGHFHVFFRPSKFKLEDQPKLTSKQYQETQGKKDNLTHLFSIAMNEYGLPTALFTVNYWVVLGVWYDATILIRELEDFKVELEETTYRYTNQWLTQMVILFKPYLIELLKTRDEVIALESKKKAPLDFYFDKNIEVLSLLRF